MALVCRYLRGRPSTLVGPNGPGAISPGSSNVGNMPREICSAGRLAPVSRRARKRMGDAGAVITGYSRTVRVKAEVLGAQA